jgi:hypothetical protein
MVLTTTQDAQMIKNHAEWNGDFVTKGNPMGFSNYLKGCSKGMTNRQQIQETLQLRFRTNRIQSKQSIYMAG